MEYYVYKHTDKTNGKSYIGRTRNIKARWQPKKYEYCSKFYKAILEHGWDNFTHEILKVCNETDADYWERYYIKKYNTVEDGYNLDSGGYKGKKQAPETIAKKSAFMKGKKNGLGHIPWNKGLKMSEEYRHKLSLAHIGQNGHTWTEEQKEKIRQSNLGKKRSEETRIKLSISHKGQESRQKVKIVNIDTGEVFESLTLAGKKYKIDIRSISANLHKKTKSSGGYHWEFYKNNGGKNGYD